MDDTLPRFEHIDDIAVVTLNDPGTFNGLSPAVFTRLREIIAEVDARAGRDIRALVLTGSGKAFCAGAELNSIFRSAPEGRSVGQHIAQFTREIGTPALMDLHRVPVPFVTAVNGVAAGLGLSIAFNGDVVLAARSASFVVPFFTRLGIVPDGGLTWQLPRLVGHARASAMALLGERMSAEAAEQCGLIWRCVDDAALLPTAMDAARRLARLPAYACHEMRAALAASQRNTYEQQYEYELRRNEELLDGPDFREGLSAFLEKREPRYPS